MSINPYDITYWLDATDRIIKVSSSWNNLATVTNSQAILEEKIVGQRLWVFIQGSTTRLWVDAVLNYARISGKAVEKQYRCDSPTDKQFMLMRVIPLSREILEVQCNVEATVPLKTRIEFTTANTFIPSLTTRCSICNRLKIKQGWLEPDDEQITNYLDTRTSVKVIYGVCPTCQDQVRRLREAVCTDNSRHAPSSSPSNVQSPMA